MKRSAQPRYGRSPGRATSRNQNLVVDDFFTTLGFNSVLLCVDSSNLDSSLNIDIELLEEIRRANAHVVNLREKSELREAGAVVGELVLFRKNRDLTFEAALAQSLGS